MTAPQEGAIATMSISDRQRDPQTGRFIDPDPTDRPVRPTAAQARKLYAEMDALKALAEKARRDADGLQALLATEEEARKAWEATANKRQSRIEDMELQVKGWKERVGEHREQAATALNERAEMARDKAALEALVADYQNAVLREERAGHSAAIVGICITAVVCTSAGWLLRHFAQVWGWLHG